MNPRSLLSLLVASLLIFTTGCYHVTYRTHAPSVGVPSSEAWHHNFLDGLVEGSEPVEVSEICPAGFAQVDREVTFVNWLAEVLLEGAVSSSIYAATSRGGRQPGYTVPFSIWSPKTISVTCARVASAPPPLLP